MGPTKGIPASSAHRVRCRVARWRRRPHRRRPRVRGAPVTRALHRQLTSRSRLIHPRRRCAAVPANSHLCRVCAASPPPMFPPASDCTRRRRQRRGIGGRVARRSSAPCSSTRSRARQMQLHTTWRASMWRMYAVARGARPPMRACRIVAHAWRAGHHLLVSARVVNRYHRARDDRQPRLRGPPPPPFAPPNGIPSAGARPRRRISSSSRSRRTGQRSRRRRSPSTPRPLPR